MRVLKKYNNFYSKVKKNINQVDKTSMSLISPKPASYEFVLKIYVTIFEEQVLQIHVYSCKI